MLRVSILFLLLSSILTPAHAVVINEIMYHPPHGEFEPEDLGTEFLELYNPSEQAVDLAGWSFTRGLCFTFPVGTVIAAESYLVVAGDPQRLGQLYPGLNTVFGPWLGRLSNAGEALELVNADGLIVDTLAYADSGDWSQRELGPWDHEHRGWEWSNRTDGGGYSLELQNPSLPNEIGQCWQSSDVSGGTPGAANSTLVNEVAPLILDVEHTPLIPDADQTVTVQTCILDESDSDFAVTLFYRSDSTLYPDSGSFPHRDPWDFTAVEMHRNSDGHFLGQIPPQPEGTVMEFYIQAVNGMGLVRNWPGPAEVNGVNEQVVNALYRVDGAVDVTTYWKPGAQPLFYLVLKQGELDELYDISDRDYEGPFFASEAMSNAQMNGTLIYVDGTGASHHYQMDVRNRGNRSRAQPPMSFRLEFPRDLPWRGRTALNLNSPYTPLQVMGSALFRMAGLAAADATPVQLRVNGEDLASHDTGMTYGSYVAIENLDGAWADHHFPADASGNLYRCTYHDDGYNPCTFAEMDYKEEMDQEPDRNDYRNNYPKKTHTQSHDWSDLFHLIDVLNNPAISDEAFMAETGAVVNHHKWARYFATDALIGNAEGGLSRSPANGDDYALYSGIADPRFWLVPHDLDTVLGQGSPKAKPDSDLLVYAEVDGLQRLMSHPDMLTIYYGQLQQLTQGILTPERVEKVAEQLLGDWVSQSLIQKMINYMTERQVYVLEQLALQTPSDPPDLTDTSALEESLGLCLSEVAVSHREGEPGWVEISNSSDQPMDLSGIALVQGFHQALRYVIPAMKVLGPGQYRVLDTDKLGFDLDSQGGRIALLDSTGQVLDELVFGRQLRGLTIGRAEVDRAWTLTLPTRGQTNVAQPLGDPRTIKINEWLASERVTLRNDFIELYNPNPDPVNLGGMYLTDNLASLPDKKRITDLSFIAGQGRFVFQADDQIRPGHLNFKLSSYGEVLALLDQNQQEIDVVIYGPQTTDWSQGSSPDGAERYDYFALPTPGMANPRAAQTEKHTILPLDQTWRYYQDGPAPEGWQASDFNDLDWPTGPGLLYVESSSLPGPKNTPLERGSMTFYFRTHLDLPSAPDDTAQLKLFTVIDDGAIVYVNEQEVLRLRVPEGPVDYETRASATVSNAEIEGPFVLPASVFRAGDNVIAVEVHQTNSTSSDIVMGCFLDSETDQEADTLHAPALQLQQGLRITELMYYAPGGSDRDYVELMNVTGLPLDVTGVQFTDGIRYTFPTLILEPYQRVIVAADPAAFTQTYDSPAPLLGPYQGRLSNGGERLVLQLPAPYEAAILRFSYDDAWYPSTDGAGGVLEIGDPSLAPAAWADSTVWRAATPNPGR